MISDGDISHEWADTTAVLGGYNIEIRSGFKISRVWLKFIMQETVGYKAEVVS